MKVKQQKYEMIAQKPHCENFIPIQTKDFHCLNSDNLKKTKPLKWEVFRDCYSCYGASDNTYF